MASSADEPPIFFVHVRKTGGTTFMEHVAANFSPEERYPSTLFEPDAKSSQHAKTSASHLLKQPRTRLDQVRLFSPHLAFWVSDALAETLDCDLTRLTILRHPVDRAISHLKVLAQIQGWNESLERLYQVPRVRNWTLWNHQVLQFALTSDDEASMRERATVLWTDPEPLGVEIEPPIVLDESRLAKARANLSRVEVVGFTESFDGFVHQINRRFGWAVASVEKRNVSARSDVPKGLRDRIAADCAADLDFYDHARRTRADG